MSMRVSETMIFVHDFDKAVHFYVEHVGFKLKEKHDWGFALLYMDDTHLLGIMDEAKWTRQYPDDDGLPRPRVAIQTDDFEGEMARLKAAGVHMGAPVGKAGETQSVNFWDEDENAFFLWCEPGSC